MAKFNLQELSDLVAPSGGQDKTRESILKCDATVFLPVPLASHCKMAKSKIRIWFGCVFLLVSVSVHELTLITCESQLCINVL